LEWVRDDIDAWVRQGDELVADLRQRVGERAIEHSDLDAAGAVEDGDGFGRGEHEDAEVGGGLDPRIRAPFKASGRAFELTEADVRERGDEDGDGDRAEADGPRDGDAAA
jgi:hypothetical protein